MANFACAEQDSKLKTLSYTTLTQTVEPAIRSHLDAAAKDGEVSNSTYKLLEYLLLRHANAQATREGGSARSVYTDIREHFMRKTGFEF